MAEKDIGRVAIALAKRCFYGEAALAAATLYGKGGTKQKLAGQKLQDLRKALEQTPPFHLPSKSTCGHHEQEKKRQYDQRIREVEHSTFTP